MGSELAHLRLANETRFALAAIRKRCMRGELDLTELLDDPPPIINSQFISEVVAWQRGFRESRAGKLLFRANVSPNKVVGELTLNEKYRIVDQWAAR